MQDQTLILADELDEQDIQTLIEMVKASGEGVLTDDEAERYAAHMAAKGDETDHYANLAEYLTDSQLHQIALDVVQWVQWDEQSRVDWIEREKRGIQALGVGEKTYGGADFEGASRATHPLLMEACTQFSARAITELWPATGPVKTQIMGKVTEELTAQAERVELYMNYQYTNLMPGGFEEEDRLLFRLPLAGSCFKKVAYDPIERTVVSRFIEPSDFVVPYTCTDLRSAIRYTERRFEESDTVRRKMLSGQYRNSEWPLQKYPYESSDYPKVRSEIEETEGKHRVAYAGDERHTIFECYCRLELEGTPFQDKDEQGEPTGMSLPYIVTVDRDFCHVHSIRRGWAANDPDKRRRVFHIHKRFLPGLGFYGLGFLHAIGGLSDTATGILRALLDSAQFANLPGGYKSRDSRIPGGSTPIKPGEWREVDSSSEELQKAFFPLPYKEPSKMLLELLGLVTDRAERFAATTEAMVGDAPNNGPVGTTIALIEQGSKVFSAIHKRLHHANASEFRLVAELNAEWMPEHYPYRMPGEDRYTLRADFDDRVDVLPVSDPNIVSNVQRIAQAQAVLQLSQQAPDLYDRKQVHRSLLEALRIQDIDQIMPNLDHIPRREPIEEGMCLLMGKPLKVIPDQEHQAHIRVHQQWYQSLPPEYQQMLQGAFMAHMAEHRAWVYRLQMQAIMGIPLPPPSSLLEHDDQDIPHLPPELDLQISVMAASALQGQAIQQGQIAAEQQMQAAMQQQALQQASDQRAYEAQMIEQQRKDAQLQAQIAREDTKARADILRADALARADIQRKAEESMGGYVDAEQDRLLRGEDYRY